MIKAIQFKNSDITAENHIVAVGGAWMSEHCERDVHYNIIYNMHIDKEYKECRAGFWATVPI